jgi:molecular chaperone GrpE
MSPEAKDKSKIPVNFLDSEGEGGSDAELDESMGSSADDPELISIEVIDDDESEPDSDAYELEIEPPRPPKGSTGELALNMGGPEVAELVASRAELKRLEGEVKELRDSLARRQADFENYRKRMERERSDTYNHLVVDLATKLLPVLDNLKRALDTEASVEASESDEFRHFLSGVDLIYKQLNGVLDALGVKPVLAEGEKFDPHLHEAVVTEPTDEFEPDTVMQEIVRGFRVGEKLIRPSLVKVAVKK